MSKPTQSPLLSIAAWSARHLPVSMKRALYRSGPLARLLRGELNRAAPQGMSTVTIAAGELQGTILSLDMQTEKDYWLGTYETDLQTALHTLVKPGMIAYDVGANVGYISLILAKLVGAGGKVFAFEAFPENVTRLQANLELNGCLEATLTPNERVLSSTAEKTGDAEILGEVTVVPAAVVDKAGPVSFLVGPSGGMGKAEGSAGRQDVAYHEKISIVGISLDEFVYQQGNPPPQLVKIDIEGGEVLALPGMKRLLKEAHPVLLMELHGPEAAQVAWETLQAAGYRICRMQPGFTPVPSLDVLDWKSYLVGF